MIKLRNRWTIFGMIGLALVVSVWQVSIALAQAPLPNPLASLAKGGDPRFAPLPGVDITQNGAAASIHGDPARGRVIFAQNCAACHNDRGIGNLPNPGSDDGTVPPLNPIDPGFLEQSGGDPAKFAQAVDLFVQHGSRPAGDAPSLSMIPWGDAKYLSQPQIADVEAYVMELNGVYWPDHWAPPVDVRVAASLDAANNEVTYQITLANESAADLTNLDLTDALPAGLIYESATIPNSGGNAPKVTNGSLEWNNPGTVPQGGTLGPFTVKALVQGDMIPSNVVGLAFSWTAAGGSVYRSTAVSDPTLPAPPPTPKPAPPPPVAAAPVVSPAATPTSAAPTPTAVASVPATPSAIPSPTQASSNASAPTDTPASSETAQATPEAAQPTPTEVPATPTPAPPTPTPAPAVPAPVSVGAQMVQPGPSALSWGFAPPSITIHVGDTVIWTNAGTYQHTVTADNGAFDSGNVNAGATWSFTFTSPGTYTYHCTPHPWMKGTIVVQGS